jgi:hypothetical protein
LMMESDSSRLLKRVSVKCVVFIANRIQEKLPWMKSIDNGIARKL